MPALYVLPVIAVNASYVIIMKFILLLPDITMFFLVFASIIYLPMMKSMLIIIAMVYPADNNGTDSITKHRPIDLPTVIHPRRNGWGVDLHRNVVPTERQQGAMRRTRLTLNEFYAYRVVIQNNFSTTHLSCLLLQQYLFDAFTKIEGNELTYIRMQQSELRVE